LPYSDLTPKNQALKRYAVYSAPRPDSLWWTLWSQWLGRDAITQQSIPLPELEGVEPQVLKSLVKDPARYGLHATLKAPFVLQAHHSLDDLRAQVQAIASNAEPFALELKLEKLNHFFALTPTGSTDSINRLAKEVVSRLDPLRASLTEEDLKRRRLSPLTPLTPREDELLVQWGYPYVMECFRFHLSLTGPLTALDASVEGLIQKALSERLLQLKSRPYEVDSLCLFEEAHPGAAFSLIERFDFKHRVLP
jgi:Protein of unknown function (DUF1045)